MHDRKREEDDQPAKGIHSTAVMREDDQPAKGIHSTAVMREEDDQPAKGIHSTAVMEHSLILIPPLPSSYGTQKGDAKEH